MFCIVIFSSLCWFYLSLSRFFFSVFFFFFKPMNIFHVYLHRHKCFFTFIPLLSSVFVSVFLFLLSSSFVQRVHGQAWPNSFFGLFVGSCFFSLLVSFHLPFVTVTFGFFKLNLSFFLCCFFFLFQLLPLTGSVYPHQTKRIVKRYYFHPSPLSTSSPPLPPLLLPFPFLFSLYFCPIQGQPGQALLICSSHQMGKHSHRRTNTGKPNGIRT